jgi:hypothetical protein
MQQILCFYGSLGLIISEKSTVLIPSFLHFLSLPVISGLMHVSAFMTVAFALENNLQKLWCVL